MATYYMRSDGTAANKAAATGPASDASACMNISVHNGEAFVAGDIIYISDQGGDFDCSGIEVTVPSSGADGNPIIYQAVSNETPIFDADGSRAQCWRQPNKDYITVDGLTFKNATQRMFLIRGNTVSTTGHIVQNCTFTGDGGGKGIDMFTGTNKSVSDVLIDSCTFDTLDGTAGVMFFYEVGTATIYDVTIQNCTFDSISNDGVSCRGIDVNLNDVAADVAADRLPYGITISNNTFNEINASAMRIYCKDTSANTISYNTITYVGYGGNYSTNAIQTHACKGLTIEYNDISYTEASTDAGDGNAIILDWSPIAGESYPTTNTIVRYNNCYNNVPQLASTGAGILLFRAKDCSIYYNICRDNLAGVIINCNHASNTGNVFYNNVIVDNTNDGVYVNQTGSQSTTWTNNIIANNGAEGFDDNSTNNPTFTYNCLYNNTGGNYSGFTLGAGCIEVDPLFIDPTNNNYRLEKISPCKNTGTDVALTQDYDGNIVPIGTNPDMGAYETLLGNLLDEGFENTGSPGYDNTWTEVVAGGSIDENASFPAVGPHGLEGECLKSTVDANLETAYIYHTLQPGGTNTSYIRFYLYVDTLGVSNPEDTDIVRVYNSDFDYAIYVQIHEHDVLSGRPVIKILLYSGGGLNITDTATLYVDTWYCVEIKYDTAAMEYAWRLDGVVQASGSLTDAVFDGLRIMSIGNIFHGGTALQEIYIDEILWSDSDWPGLANRWDSLIKMDLGMRF